MSTHPIIVVQDRYGGVYSGGAWLAVACATDVIDGALTRASFCLLADDGPSGSDTDAAFFWRSPPSWIAVGQTPDEAYFNLRNSPT